MDTIPFLLLRLMLLLWESLITKFNKVWSSSPLPLLLFEL